MAPLSLGFESIFRLGISFISKLGFSVPYKMFASISIGHGGMILARRPPRESLISLQSYPLEQFCL